MNVDEARTEHEEIAAAMADAKAKQAADAKAKAKADRADAKAKAKADRAAAKAKQAADAAAEVEARRAAQKAADVAAYEKLNPPRGLRGNPALTKLLKPKPTTKLIPCNGCGGEKVSITQTEIAALQGAGQVFAPGHAPSPSAGWAGIRGGRIYGRLRFCSAGCEERFLRLRLRVAQLDEITHPGSAAILKRLADVSKTAETERKAAAKAAEDAAKRERAEALRVRKEEAARVLAELDALEA